jgi:hypothetical protein
MICFTSFGPWGSCSGMDASANNQFCLQLSESGAKLSISFFNPLFLDGGMKYHQIGFV